MKIQVLRQADYPVSVWSGGVTTQLAIWPPQAQYAARCFDWRVSSAAVTAEESVFTSLPDYTRYLAILDGRLRLRHNGGSELTLHPLAPHVFDGADETRARGTCTDFNLMLRKGVCGGRMRPVCTGAGQTVCLQIGMEDCEGEQTAVLYCVRGGVTLTADGRQLRLSPTDTVLLRFSGSTQLHISGGQPGACMLAEIWSETKNEAGIPAFAQE